MHLALQPDRFQRDGDSALPLFVAQAGVAVQRFLFLTR
jgi:hypothetical protein